ncbi:MAG: EAL domain-containing protein [Terracidiphilus sp.]|jgi:diguanylate cyclase (GGDEF)-like protein/PAS domain S-box-containing protein
MLYDGFAKGPHAQADPEPNVHSEPPLNVEALELSTPVRPRPFRERRRSRSAEESRHEALNSVDRLLVHQERALEYLKTEELKYRSLFEESPVGIFRMSFSGRLLSVNRMMARIYGYDSPEQLLAETADSRQQFLVEPSRLKEWKASVEISDVSRIEAEIQCRDGANKWVWLNMRAARDENGIAVHLEGTVEDITDRREATEHLRFLAYYDPLTGLPNPTLFQTKLAEAIELANLSNSKVALLVLELARFKIVNDSFGHAFGDRLLQETAERIRIAVGNDCTVARIGGGEFAIALDHLDNAASAMATAQEIAKALADEFCIMGHSLNISYNLGISIFPDHGVNGEALLQNADVALYSAKEEGPNRALLFTEEMNVQIMAQLTLANSLQLALARNELFLVYQPQVNTQTGKITGLEALLRWQHPQLGLVPPAKFIGLAERSGLIVPIGEWVLRTACAQAKEWQEAGLLAVPVAVNVSAIQFRQQGFPELIRDILKETGLDPKYLELELTESLLLTNADVMFSILQELRDMEVKLAIDDFGTGYSSLSYLRQFRVNRLKIDRSFVRDVAINPDDAAIATAIINMARALNLEVLAEGVETEEQLGFFRAQHCYEVQGFYFSKPVTVSQIAGQLRAITIHPAPGPFSCPAGVNP